MNSHYMPLCTYTRINLRTRESPLCARLLRGFDAPEGHVLDANLKGRRSELPSAAIWAKMSDTNIKRGWLFNRPTASSEQEPWGLFSAYRKEMRKRRRGPALSRCNPMKVPSKPYYVAYRPFQMSRG
jgi:hypothetical protein